MATERHPLWARLPEIPEPSAEQLERVRLAVEARAGRIRARRRWLWIVPALLFGSGTSWWAAKTVSMGAMSREAPQPRGAGTTTLPISLVTGPAPLPTESTPTASTAAPESRVEPAPTLLPASPSTGTPVTKPLARRRESHEDPEAALLGEALLRLRRGNDPQGALSLLRTYRVRFPDGVLESEATLVRVEAMVGLGRHQELVDFLTPRVIAQSPRPGELKAVRAEALAHLGRCPQALLLYDSLLDGDASDMRLTERALYGRATCRALGGDFEAARRDLETERREFPEDASKVEQTLRSFRNR